MYQVLLYVHIFFGAIALLSGVAALSVKKGSSLHKKSGIIYYYCMYGVGLFAIILTLLKFNPFLLSIGIFSLYLTYSGKRAIDFWRMKKQYHPSIKDKLPNYIALITSLFMIGYPVVIMVINQVFSVPILAVFGLIMLLNARRDIVTYSNIENFKPRNKNWLFTHIGMMTGAFIATLTAFLVNNVTMNPAWVPWLAPTIIGVPYIFINISKWKTKLKVS